MTSAHWLFSWLVSVGSSIGRGQLGLDITALAVLSYSILLSPWRLWLAGPPERRRIWLAGIVLVWIVWSLRAPIAPGLALHFLLTTSLTLILGPLLALAAVGMVVIAQCVQHLDWSAGAATYLCDGVFPIVFIHFWHSQIARHLPRNYWVLFFVTVFIGSAMTFVIAGFAKAVVASIVGSLSLGSAMGDDLIVLAMMGFGEATLNGFLMAPAIIFHPEWVASIDERTYAARLSP